MLRALARLEAELAPMLPEGVPHFPAVEARLSAGIPALLEEPLLDGTALRKALRAASRLLSSEATDSPVQQAANHLTENPDLADAIVEPGLAGDWETIGVIAVRAGLDPEITVVLADYTVRPWLRLAAIAIGPLIAAAGWSAGYCPACGAPPALAELRGTEHERVLRCARCAMAWSFPRLACPTCGERQHQRLGYLHTEGQAEFRRADICENCHGYVKAIAVLDPFSPAAQLDADLATIALDFAAIERGYHRATSRPPAAHS